MQIIAESLYIRKLMADAYKQGFLEGQKVVAPVTDEIRNCDLKEWLASMRLDYRIFLKFKANGLVRPFRKGTKPNSALFFSRAEIIKAFDTMERLREAPRSFRALNKHAIEEMKEFEERGDTQREARPLTRQARGLYKKSEMKE